MILLTVIAVGMLGLSAISLRGISGSESMAQARANARMALLMALAELQKTAGTDRAITTPASLVDESKPSGLTGVWEPWDASTPAAARTQTAREERFRQWLVSAPGGQSANELNAPPLDDSGASLLGDGSLGSNNDSGDQRIYVQPSDVAVGNTYGGLAWVVIDEGTKARLNLHERDSDQKESAIMRVSSPPTDGVAALDGLENLQLDEDDAEKLITFDSVGLVGGLDQGKLKSYSPHLTVHSESLMTNVREGGLKKDFSLWTTQGLNTSEQSQRLYLSSGALNQSVPSDPLIGLLTNYHNYYKNLGRRSGTISPPSDGVAAKLPSRYTPIRRGEPSPSTPLEPIMVPSIVRVDVIFSLISRDVHGGRTSSLISAGRRYMLHMLYLPVITLHNPYNVPLSVEGLKVTFKNVPVAFQFLVNRQPVTSQLVPLNQMYANFQGGPRASKDFSCTLSGAIGSSAASSFVLEPGQTKLFGTPKVDPDWSWADEKPGQIVGDGVALFDWRNNQTSDFRMAPKLMTDSKTGAGFDIDWLAPMSLQTTLGKQCGFGEGIVALRGNELIGVNFAPYAPPAGGGKFDIEIELIQRGRASAAGGFSINYGDANRLKQIVETGTSLRFPTARNFPETFPQTPFERPFRVTQIYEANNTSIKDYVRPKPFLIFSVGSRTTKESFTPTRVFADGSPVMNIANVDLRAGKDPLGGAPLEMVMMPIRDGNAAIEDIRDTEEGFAFGGSGTLNGTPRATFYELPMGPLQSLAQFRHANLAGSGYMPHVTYTVGESRAHPQIGASDIIGRWASDNSTMLDHTWLSNEALWDSYFLSSIADLEGPAFGQKRGYAELMKNFFNLSERLPNQRFRPYGTDSVPPELSSDPEDKVAAYLLLRGGFNVNSTSVEAWTAVLSAMREREIETADGMDSAEPESTPMARVSRPSDKNIDRMAVNLVESRWQGYRSLTDDQISDLAEKIVDQIRARGPFLSLADFVNRGVGPDGDEKNISGAIQAAIDALPKLNQVMEADGITLDEGMLANHGYASTRAATQAGANNTASSAPGMITQGDILTGLGSRITVRSDTFRVRAYGEARDNTGKKVQAKAWCEAIVQRVPDYVDPVDDATAAPASLSDTNRIFGRRFEVVSFRWLEADEV